MTPEPDECLLLLAQIALEGVILSPEVQANMPMKQVRQTLVAARYRNEHGIPQPRYVVVEDLVTDTMKVIVTHIGQRQA